MKKARHNVQLMCSVNSLVYDFPGHCGHIFFPDCHCCDMEGCINMFEAIDSDVSQIITFSGHKPDTIYFKKNGEWKAYIAKVKIEPVYRHRLD